MANPDLSVFGNIRTVRDFDRLNQEFALKKQLAAQQLQKAAQGGDLPAPLQLANEYQRRVSLGDTAGANLIMQFAKTQDRGLQVLPDGTYGVLPGYAPAVAGIEGAKAGAKQQAEANVDLNMKPRIGQNTVFAEAMAKNKADAVNTQNKKGVQATNMLDLITEAKTVLPDASGGGLSAGYAAGKGFAGISDASTRANARLDVIGPALVANIPRMEGPQSDADRKLYEQSAGNVNNKLIPVKDRLASLDTLEKLQQKYSQNSNSILQLYGSEAEGNVVNPPVSAGGWSIREIK